MGRQLRTTLPVLGKVLDPKQVPAQTFAAIDARVKGIQKENYDKRHRASDLPPMTSGQSVWVTDMQRPGTVTSTSAAPRSYVIQTEKGPIRRNRFHLIQTEETTKPAKVTPCANSSGQTTREEVAAQSAAQNQPEDGPVPMRTAKGRVVRPPKRLDL